MKKNYSLKLIAPLFLIGLLAQFSASAQQEMGNSMSQYYSNRMMWNPGFTGVDGNKIYVMQNRSWVDFDGAPVMTNISGEFQFGLNSSAGLQVMNDEAGALYRTYGVFNYAYRIKFSKEEQLRIGVSLALEGDRLNINYIDERGAVDPVLANSINQSLQYDGNIGFVYMNKKLVLGASFFRLKDNLTVKSGGSANLPITQLGAGYDISLNKDDKVFLKPLIMARVYRTTGTLLDFGMQFEYNKIVNTMLVYQTNGNIRAGAGIQIKNIGEANFFYNTNTKISNTSSQQYEVGLSFFLKGKKQD